MSRLRPIATPDARTRLLRLMVMLAAVILATPGFVTGQTQLGDISVHVEPGMLGRGRHGYFEYRVLVSNRSATSEHQVTLEMPDEYHPPRGGSRGHIRSLRRNLHVSPRSSLSVSLFQPDLVLAGADLVVTVDRRQRAVIPLAKPSWALFPHYYGEPSPCLLVSSAVDLESQIQIDTGRMGVVRLRANVLAADELQSTSWLAYSSFDVIILTSHEIDQLSQQVRAALEGYLRCGGTLMVIGEPDQSLTWPLEIVLPPGLSKISYGFGCCLLIGSATGTRLDPGIWSATRDEWETSARPWSLDLFTDISGMTVVEGLRIPVRSLFLLMIGFAVIIGPVNLLLLRRRRRQLWLLWTTPLISVVTSAGIFFYALIAEGVTTLVRIEGVTLLDQPNQRATTLGGLAYYSPLAPGDGLHFPIDAELSALIPWDQAATGRVIDWSHDQHFSRGWVSARLPAHFKWRSDTHCRQRLVVRSGTGDRPEVVNGLGTRIKELWLADSAGNTFHTRDLAEGATTTMGPVSFRPGPTRSSLRDFYDKPWHSIDTTIRSWLLSLLDPGTYVALVEVNPFIEPGLPEYELVKSSGVICGVYADGIRFAGRSVILLPAPVDEDPDDAG